MKTPSNRIQFMKPGYEFEMSIEKPKYQMLKDYIAGTIESRQLKPGEKISSKNELSAKFGISRHTVRQAIGELVSEGWLYRTHGKGTFVNQKPEKKADTIRTIGVITTYLNDYIFPAIIRGIDGVLSINNYNIVLGCTYNQHDKEKLCLENFQKQNLSGLIVEPTKSALPNPNIGLYKELHKNGVPVLFIHGCYKELNYPYVVEDDLNAGYMATRHLMDFGHSRIGGVFKFDDSQLAIASEVKLTTIAHPKEKLGKEAATFIIKMIDKRNVNHSVKMQPQLIVRESTRKIGGRIGEL